MENGPLVIEKFNFFYYSYPQLDLGVKCENYHLAVISGGLSGDFIIYRHRAIKET